MGYFRELGEVLSAEYCTRRDCTHDHYSTVDPPHTRLREAAFLRAAHRARLAVPYAELLDHLGGSPRTDQLVAMLLDQIPGAATPPPLTEAVRARLAEAGPDGARTTALLDLATQRRLTPLPLPSVVALAGNAPDPRVRRAALRHLVTCPPDGDDPLVLGLGRTLTAFDEVLTWITAAHARGHDRPTIEKFLATEHRDAVRFVPRPVPRPKPGATLLQLFPMWGPLDQPGEGDSGGIAMFLSSLGDALAHRDEVSTVVTLHHIDADSLDVAAGWTPPPGAGHVRLGLPVALPGMVAGHPQEPLCEIGWWLRTLLPGLELVPDVAHVRFGSDVTLAVARCLRALGVRIVFTIAPDPHRLILGQHHTDTGELDSVGLANDLHRLFAAQTLAEWSDGVVALPSAHQRQETSRHFPQVLRRLGPVPAIPEGIVAWRDRPDDGARGKALVERLFAPADSSGLSRDARGLPVLLNVGRWNPLKQQDVLVRAWLDSGLCESSVLVLVGGTLSDPAGVERRMRQRVLAALKAAGPACRGRFAWLPRLANRDVRLLQRAMTEQLPSDTPHVYLCCSVKEEFGISILEAMDAGFLAIAPRLGGAGHYITPGQTGFLADTSSVWNLASDMRLVLGGSWSARQLTAVAQEGHRLVRDHFSIVTAAERFAGKYLGLIDQTVRTVTPR